MIFCTLTDKNYLLKGLAMYQSLKSTLKLIPVKLYWLCMDQQTYDALRTVAPGEIIPILLEDMEREHAELRQAKNNPNPGEYGNQYSQYCWALAPWFIHYVLHRFARNQEAVIYVDSDIIFYASPQVIYGIMDQKSIAIHSHRSPGPYKPADNGWFNVGVVVFKNDTVGRQACTQWKDWLMKTDHQYYKSHGSCGDQKYLELIYEKFAGETCVFDNGTIITHLAPWCPDIEPAKVMLLCHFSHFRHDLENNQWHDSLYGEWNPSAQPGVLPFYQDYFERIKAAKLLVKPKISIVGNLLLDEKNTTRIRYLRCVLRSFAFLKDHCQLILNIEGCHNAEIQRLIQSDIQLIGFDCQLYFVNGNTYGNMYSHLLSLAKYPYVLNFMEDHFCLPDDANIMLDLLAQMEDSKVDMLKATFFEVEQNSMQHVRDYIFTDMGKIFINNENNFKNYCEYYKEAGGRYYIGVNFITTWEFAVKFWDRTINSTTPHPWEIQNYDPQFLHTVMVPGFPVLAAIDDDHGAPGTALINNMDQHYKFRTIYMDVLNLGLQEVHEYKCEQRKKTQGI